MAKHQSWAAEVTSTSLFKHSMRNGDSVGGLNTQFGEEGEDETTSGHSDISEFYRDRSIFITGASGFVGKVLVEKLLRSCSGLKNIYVLIRPKDGQDARQRLDHLMASQLFDRVKKTHPSIITKVVPISGDVILPGLGISQSDLSLLANNVSVVFNCAATVRFDEPFKTSVDINVLGTRRLIELCHKMSLLAAFVHISTAYCYCNRDDIDEIVYTESVPAQKIIDAAEWMNEDLLDCIVPHLLSGRPSNYHFTKALAENLMVQEGGNLPMAIVRPSIIGGAAREPMPGWVDNFNGPSGFIVASGKGVLRTMVVESKVGADIIPVDLVVNMVVSAAWHTGRKRPNTIMVYNCTRSPTLRTTWGEIYEKCKPLLVQYPSMEMFRYPGGSFKASPFINALCIAFQHYLPAYIIDFLARVTGQKPGMVQLYQRIHRATGMLSYFTTREWTFHINNVKMLMEEQSVTDRNMFNFNVLSVNTDDYLNDYILGARRYLLKEDDSTLPAARRKLNRIYYFSQAARLILFVTISRVVINHSKTARRLWWRLVFLLLQIIQVPLSRIL